MRWRTFAACAGLLAAWGAFAGWQYRGYLHERELIHETLHQQSHSVMNALVGGMRSHRRLGRFFEVQLQGMIEELTKSQDVLAVAVLSDDGRLVLSAGEAELLHASPPIRAGDYWDPSGFRLVEEFHLAPAEWEGPGGGQGRGGGGGPGAGPGWGRGPAWRDDAGHGEGPFGGGGDFAVILVLDRTRHDRLCRGAARSHAVVSGAGAIVLACVALAWWASVRAVRARGRAGVLETEARYLRELSQAAAGLAHETRNPLGLIRGWTQRLAQSDVDARERREHTRAVIEECDRVTARINQFLAFARPHEPTPERVELDRLIDELAMILQPDLETKNVALKREVPESAATVRADRELLRQALFNLVQNAVQFSPEGETVDVAVVPGHNGECRIEVADRGPGVAEQSVASLFAPYFTTRPDGTGLGLAIVKRIAALHGWQTSYRERPGGGAIFSLDGIHA
jgi:signal transduction histidine kinase